MHSDLFNQHACDAGVSGSPRNKYYDVPNSPTSHPTEARESSYAGDSWETRNTDKVSSPVRAFT